MQAGSSDQLRPENRSNAVDMQAGSSDQLRPEGSSNVVAMKVGPSKLQPKDRTNVAATKLSSNN